MSWLDAVSSGLTAATQGAGGYLQGQAAGQKLAQAQALQAAQLLRQQHLDEQNALLQQAQIGNYKSEAETRAAQPARDAAKSELDFKRQSALEMMKADNDAKRQAAMQALADKRFSDTQAAMEKRLGMQISAADRRAGWSIQDDPTTGQKVRVNAITGEQHPLAIGAKAGGGVGGGMGGQGSQAPLDDMMMRYDEIEKHGKDLADKKFKFTNTNATREALGFGQTYQQAEGKPAIGAQIGQSMMDLFGLAKGTDPDQQRYARLMASTRAFGDDAAKVFKGRQGFQNISYEVAQATLRPEDYGHPDIIQQKLNRMRHVVKLAALVAPGQAQAADPAKLAKFLSDTPSATTGLPNPEY